MENKEFGKMFFWMFTGLLVTFITAYVISNNETSLYNIFARGLYFPLLIVELVVVIILSIFVFKLPPSAARACFLGYSFLNGLTFSAIFLVYNLSSIIYVFLFTALFFIILTFIGYTTKKDLFKFGPYLFAGLITIIIASVVNIFIGSTMLDFGLTILGLVIFIGFTIYDVNKLKKLIYNMPNLNNLAIRGALMLYIDFINLFIRLLSIFGKSKD